LSECRGPAGKGGPDVQAKSTTFKKDNLLSLPFEQRKGEKFDGALRQRRKREESVAEEGKKEYKPKA